MWYRVDCKKYWPEFPYLSEWASAIIYTISIVLYFVDHMLDIFVGMWLIGDMGVIILTVIFLPVLPTFVLALMRKIYRRRINQDIDSDTGYKHTLLGINWFNQKGGCCSVKKGTCNVIISIFFIICRIDTLRSYCQLMRATRAKNMAKEIYLEHQQDGYSVTEELHNNLKANLKKKKKLLDKWDQKLRADLYLIMVCETLPQCCLQIYIYGGNRSVSIYQIISVIFSIVDLIFNFTVFQIKRWNAIWYANVNLTREGDILEKVFDERHLNRLSEIIKKEGEPRSISIHLKFKRKNERYVLKDEELTARHKSDTFEHNFYYWVCIVVDIIGNPIFFITTFPTISLYAVISGRIFMFLYLPVFFDFIERFWWWNPDTHRRNLNCAFHTLYLAFKMLLRMMIMGLICIWFIRVLKYSVSYIAL